MESPAEAVQTKGSQRREAKAEEEEEDAFEEEEEEEDNFLFFAGFAEGFWVWTKPRW